MAATATVPAVRAAIRCDNPACQQILAWRLSRSGALVPVIAANVSDEGPGTVRIRCHGCHKRTRVQVTCDH